MQREAITFKELEIILQKISASYAERGIEHIDLSRQDFYLSLSTNEMFDLYQPPSQPLPIGSLIDDVTELDKFLSAPNHMATAVDIERLGNVLRAMSELI